MFGRKIKIFKLFNFQVQIDTSWIFIAFLVTWSLAAGYFPARYQRFSAATYWWMGVAGVAGLFLSVVLHELMHSLVASRFGLSMRGITLFVFGGVAEMEEEPSSPRAEFFIAGVGPVFSIAFGSLFYGLYGLSYYYGIAPVIRGVLAYIAWVNWILAGFNLVPAFPMDGGRILRSILWYWKKDLRWATGISSKMGSAFGIFLSLLGVLYFFMGAFVIGLWYFFIGIFLQGIARASYRRLLVRQALQGEIVKHFMKQRPITVPENISIQSLVEDYVYRYHHKFFPVTKDGKLVGCISTEEIKELPRNKWAQYQVNRVLKPCAGENTITPETEALKTLSLMNRTSKSRMVVAEKDKLLGIITLKDLLKFITLKIDLEEEEPKEQKNERTQ